MRSSNQNEWLSALSSLNQAAAQGTPSLDADLLRTFYRLFRDAPAARHNMSISIDEVDLERLLGCGAYESAALRIISPYMGVMFSSPPGQDGDLMASVWLPGSEEEVSANGQTMASALVFAASAALSDAYIREEKGSNPFRTH